MFINPRILLASTVAAVALLSACNPKDATTASAAAGAGKDSVAATVNGVPITASRVDMLMKQQAAHGMPGTPEIRKQVIEQLAMTMVIAQAAEKKGMDKTGEVADQLDLMKQNLLAKAYVQDYMKGNPVTDDVLKAEYEKVKAQVSGNEYKARHILVEKEDEASDIIAKLKKNPNAFAALAKERSKDPGSKGKGGDLGWFDPHTMVPEFGAALANVKKGAFTETPVKTQFGYHVILLEDSRAKQFPPMEQVKDQLQQQLQQKNFDKLLADMKAGAKIEIAQAASAPAPAAAVAPASAASAEKK